MQSPVCAGTRSGFSWSEPRRVRGRPGTSGPSRRRPWQLGVRPGGPLVPRRDAATTRCHLPPDMSDGLLLSMPVRVVVFCHDHPDGRSFDPDPGETSRRQIELRTTPPTDSFSVVGWRHAGLSAAALAAGAGSRADRLVLCCVPAPIDATLAFDPGDIAAKTLLLFGQADADAPSRHARWWKDRIPDSRVEMVPRAGSDIVNTMWGRVLSHAAPNRLR